MESLATENSVASIPRSHLVRLQHDLVAGPSAHDRRPHPDSQAQASRARASPDHHAATPLISPSKADSHASLPSEIASAPPPEERDRSIDHLHTMAAAHAPATPSQEAFVAMTRGSSFPGFPAGDTQLNESQVYRNFNESIVVTPKKSAAVWPGAGGAGGDGETYDTAITEKTPRTCQEGDTGYIDLMGGFQPSPLPTTQSEQGRFIQDLLHESPPPTESQPRWLAETPALPSSRKRGADGQMIPTSVTTAAKTAATPGFSQFFPRGPQGDVLSATQLFHQTQAPSSPVPNGPLSDPIASRPSPNLLHQHHFSVSSPEFSASSPIATMPHRSSTNPEPRGTYTSIRESQEIRASMLRKDFGSQRLGENGDKVDSGKEEDGHDEDGFGSDQESRRIQRQRIKRAISYQALCKLDLIRAPSRPTSSGRSGPAGASASSAPPQARSEDTVDVVLSDDESADGNDDMPLLGAEEDEEPGDTIDDGETEDNNDFEEDDNVSGMEVPADGEEDDGAVTEDGEEAGHIEEVDEEEEEQDEDEAILAGTPNDANQREALAPSATQHTTVADSQPERQEAAYGGSLSQPVLRHSSIPSFVPGSQYAGRTSQDQAPYSRDKIALVAGLRASSGLPSSPPVPASAEIEFPLPSGLINARPNASGSSGHRDGQIDEMEPEVEEIPESDIRPQKHASSNSIPSAIHHESNTQSAPLFSTAQTHVSNVSPSRRRPLVNHDESISPLKKFASQQSKVSRSSSTFSPRRAAGARRFSEINDADALPNGTHGESQVDIDAIMGSIITSQDKQHMAALSDPADDEPDSEPQPPPKRRKLMKASGPRETPALAKAAGLQEEGFAGPHLARQSGRKRKMLSPGKDDQSAVMLEIAPKAPIKQPASKALRNSPSKANEMPFSTPVQKDAPEAATPDSVRLREKAGAKAAAQVLSKRKSIDKKDVKMAEGRKPKNPKKSAKQRNGRNQKTNASNAETQERTTSIEGGSANVEDLHVEAEAAPEQLVQQSSVPMEHRGHPRIFAVFREVAGNNFYPATWLTSTPGGKSYRVQFDDGTVTTVEAHLCCSLDLRLEDTVKIDMVGVRQKSWLVKGFGDVEPNAAEATDMYGHRLVKLQLRAKQKADSATGVHGEGDVVDFPLDRIYLSSSMWGHFKNRVFVPPAQPSGATSRDATPSSGLLPTDGGTPGSRTRRSIVPAQKALSLHRRDTSVTSLCAAGKGIFANMAFAISYGGNEAEKAEVTHLIGKHGGLILEEGFDELFDLPDLDADTTATTRVEDVADTPLRIRPEYESLGFVALIGDAHSRRAKYMQALALGLPTLSGKWVLDSLSPIRNPSLTLPTPEPAPLVSWAKYLLPAGESAYLSGAVRSRCLATYSPRSASLATTISSRPLLIPPQVAGGVLIVVLKKRWLRKQAYAFLTLALGATKVRRVEDLESAKDLLFGSQPDRQAGAAASRPWKWVFVDGDVDEAKRFLFSGHGTANGKADGNGKRGKKRKFGEEVALGRSTATATVEADVKVVDDEFVLQSLILGDLVD